MTIPILFTYPEIFKNNFDPCFLSDLHLSWPQETQKRDFRYSLIRDQSGPRRGKRIEYVHRSQHIQCTYTVYKK